ncbi:DUF624 domain-containing protein [Alicyclobacillus fastidiosus]|uniref:DUF624 domain-containing protein n=2 Tax=Alicyclobacillus fastidiosus TaxID=392011 RepID=A0ABY6ZD48_9BACL|nr:DUF624 domain-containing protein [Alicyclobacillus fastidiosus]WAH40046.1 DUF624 domain-containing protein [Alicyclobacillus fastidiosus]
MFSIDGPLYKLLSISYKFVVLNIVFLISCIPIITIPISTVGIFVVARKIIDREDYSVLREFWYGVRQNWKQGLLAGGLFFIILCSVEMDLHMSIGIHSSLSVIAMYMILLISCIGILHIYPLIVYTKSTVKGLLLNAFKLILYRPWLTFFNVVILNVMFFVCMKFPILFFALFFSLSAIATNWFVRRKIQSLTFQEE